MRLGINGTVVNSTWFAVFFSIFLLSSVISWFALAQLNFLYDVWHERGGVAEHIERFAPRNRYKKDFSMTSLAERSRLFERIVDAVHHEGEGLRAINYHKPDGQKVDSLLREPEVVHLEDVARLVGLIKPVGLVSGGVIIISLAFLYFRRARFPTVKVMALYSVSLPILVGASCAIWGPTEVFYQMHRWVFPEGHQWFFYYQDSLMSTMMMAPDMFGYIAACLAFCSAIVTLGLTFTVRHRWRSIERGVS